MPIFNTPRENRTQKDYMEQLVNRVWNTPLPVLYKAGYGVIMNTAESVLDSFCMVQNANQKLIKVKVHCMEMFVEPDKQPETVVYLADCMGKYFFACGFQNFITVMQLKEGYLIECIVNAVSYRDGAVFHDNNRCYQSVLNHLRTLMPENWRLKVADSVLFAPEELKRNYTEGILG